MQLTLEQAAGLVALGTLLATMLGAMISLRAYREQFFLGIFTQYTGRYGEIIHELPFEAARPGPPIDLTTMDPDQREHVLKNMRRYFNLCWEELHLAAHRKIDKKTWEIWNEGIVDTMRSPYFRAAWEELRSEYSLSLELVALIDQAIARHPPQLASPAERDITEPRASAAAKQA